MAMDKADGITQFNGKYLGVSDASGRGSVGVAWVTVSDGVVTDVQLAEYSDGEAKGDDYSYDNFHNAKETMPERFVEADSYDVDTYSGATGSSTRWKQAVLRALVKAGLN
ncbi:MAG: FMN-binding protein [Halothermotrichaceae bacterium]